ncbi:hypothetical protein, partial [Klebsiella pneumoniae]|uniref:hypothetical protein n=1 Tax=Klebsiella pneumoniae TaxID=573 RepID=UPI00300960BA
LRILTHGLKQISSQSVRSTMAPGDGGTGLAELEGHILNLKEPFMTYLRASSLVVALALAGGTAAAYAQTGA